MKIVADTDVISAAILGQENRGKASEELLRRASVILAPGHWKAEFGNVLWKYAVMTETPIEVLENAISLAELLPVITVDVSLLWKGAFARGVTARHPVYDSLFVELAARNDCMVASWDKKFKKKFEGYVATPDDLLQSM